MIKTWNQGKSTFVISHIIYNFESIVIIDCQKNTEDAADLAKYVRSLQDKNQEVTHIIVTHGHPDHYFGLGQLHVEFPQAQILIASQGIKDDIYGYTQYTLSTNGSIPDLMIAVSSTNPKGFDYENWIEVLQEPYLLIKGGGTFNVTSDFDPTEANQESIWKLREKLAHFTGDLTYIYNFI